MAGLFGGKKKPRPMGEDEEVDAGPPMDEGAEDDGEAPPMEEGDEKVPVGDPAPAHEPPPAKGGGDVATKLVENGMRLLYSQQTLPAVIRSLDGDGNPVEGLLNTLGMVVSRLIESAEQKGVALTPDVVLKASAQLVEKLAALSQSAGAHKYTPDELEQAGQFLAEAVAGGPADGPPAGEPPPGPPPGPMAQPPPRRGLLG